MAARTGKVARIRVTSASATASTDNAATLSTDGVTLTIDSTARRHWSQTGSVAVYEDATNRTTDIASINYVQGIVTLDQARSTSASWTIDASYVTASYVAQGRSWSIDVGVDMADTTVFSTSTSDTQWRTVTPTLSAGEVTIDRLWASTTGPAFFDRLTTETATIVELWTDATYREKFEGYAYVAGDDFTVPVDDLAGESVTLMFDGQVYHSTA